MDAFTARLNASEGTYFLGEQKSATERHIQKLVDQGKLPRSSLAGLGDVAVLPGLQFADVPTTVINSKPASERVFEFDGKRVPRMSATESWARLGTAKVSLGRAKWNSDGASIFSVQDGKRLAQTPAKLPTPWELNRARKIAEASIDGRVVSGIRLMPEFTPGRAMLWGSILALWGTGALVATAARRLDIHSTEEAGVKLREVVLPYVGFSERFFEPLKGRLQADDANAGLHTSLKPVKELARKMREKLGHTQHT